MDCYSSWIVTSLALPASAVVQTDIWKCMFSCTHAYKVWRAGAHCDVIIEKCMTRLMKKDGKLTATFTSIQMSCCRLRWWAVNCRPAAEISSQQLCNSGMMRWSSCRHSITLLCLNICKMTMTEEIQWHFTVFKYMAMTMTEEIQWQRKTLHEAQCT